MKSIQKNKAHASKMTFEQPALHEGGIDALIVSTEPGDPEPQRAGMNVIRIVLAQCVLRHHIAYFGVNL